LSEIQPQTQIPLQTPTRCGFVALIGAPNAGKSTITNHFVGSKVSIVSPKVQTTRTLVKGIGIFDNTQIIFLDTPGIFKPKRHLDRAMVSSAWDGVTDADIVVLVVDAKRGFDDETRHIIARLKKKKQKAVLVLNKVDLVQKDVLLGLSKALNDDYAFDETFFVSAVTGQNIDDFYRYLADNLPESPWYYPEDQISDMPLKLLAAEIVREKTFLFLHQELPYAITVEPELWERREDGSVRAEITIYVERDNQKVIVLGKGGSMIKRIGQTARREIEELLECRIHLFLFVKVRENWQEDSNRYSVWGLDFKA
jgi:GTP-binding protein Era